MAKKTVSDLSKSGQVNSFSGGLNTDLHPMLQPNDTLTDCLNGTLITYNGNENMLQNDMGNYELKHAQLPEGYIPMGIKEYQGILYIASWNPFTKRAQIGSYPSPRTIFGDETQNEYVLEPLPIAEYTGSVTAETIFKIMSKDSGIENPEKYLVSELDYSKSEVIFTPDYGEESTLGVGDFYNLQVENPNEGELFQHFKYFIVDKNQNRFDVTDEVISSNSEDFSFNPVVFDHNGWLGAKYELDDIVVPELDIQISSEEWTTENITSEVIMKECEFDASNNWVLDTIYSSKVDPEIYLHTELLPPDTVPDYYYEARKELTNSPVQCINAFDEKIANTFSLHKNCINFIIKFDHKALSDDKLEAYNTIKKGYNEEYVRLEWDLSSTNSIDIHQHLRFLGFNSTNVNIEYVILPQNELLLETSDTENLFTFTNVVCLDGISDTERLRDYFNVTQNVFIPKESSGEKLIIGFGNDAGWFFSLSQDWPSTENTYNELYVFGIRACNYNFENYKYDSLYIKANKIWERFKPYSSENKNLALICDSECLWSANEYTFNKLFLSVENYNNDFLVGSKSNYIYTTHQYDSDDGQYIYSRDNTTLIFYNPYNENVHPSLRIINIPNGTTTVTKNALYSIKFKDDVSRWIINKLVIPDTIESIAYHGWASKSIENAIIDLQPSDNVVKAVLGHSGLANAVKTAYWYPDSYSWAVNRLWMMNNLLATVDYDQNPIVCKSYDVGMKLPIEYKTLTDFAINNTENIYILSETKFENIDRKYNVENNNTVVLTTNQTKLSSYDIPYYNTLRDLQQVECPKAMEIGSFRSTNWIVHEGCKFQDKYVGNNIYLLESTSIDSIKRFLEKNSHLQPQSVTGVINLYVEIAESDEVKAAIKDFIPVRMKVHYGNEITTSSNSDAVLITYSDDIPQENWLYCSKVESEVTNAVELYKIEVTKLISQNLSFDNNYGSVFYWISALFNDEIKAVLLPNNELQYTLITEISAKNSELLLVGKNLPEELDPSTLKFITYEELQKLVTAVGLIGDRSFNIGVYDWDISFPNSEENPCNSDFILSIKTGYSPISSNLSICYKTLIFSGSSSKWVCGTISNLNDFLEHGCLIVSEASDHINIKADATGDISLAIKITEGLDPNKSYYSTISLQNTGDLIEIEGNGQLYTFDIIPYIYQNNKLLIYDSHKYSISSVPTFVKSHIIGYKYLTAIDYLTIYLEFANLVDFSGADWYIKSLNGEEQASGTCGSTTAAQINITTEWKPNKFDDICVFEYHTNGVVYKKPIFPNWVTKELPYNDYSNAYYDEISPNTSLNLKDYITLSDPQILGSMQIAQTATDGVFSFDTLDTVEQPKGLWWKMLDKFEKGDHYLGTRIYKNVSLDLHKLGLVKGKSLFGISYKIEGYDKEITVRPNSLYTGSDNSTFSFCMPVAENKGKISYSSEKIHPFEKEYLVQKAYPNISNISEEDLYGEDNNTYYANILSACSDWDKSKMLFVDKVEGENNDCIVSLLNPEEYDSGEDKFKNGVYCSGQTKINELVSNIKSFIVPIVARVKTNDNGFVFPVPGNSRWSYKTQWVEARTKKNSDNKRSIWKNGVMSICHTKNNMAAAIANIILGGLQLLATMWTWLATAVTTIFVGGSLSALVPLAILENVTGITMFTYGMAELFKKEKTFKLLALRGKDRLLLPLWGCQSNLKKFGGQARYEIQNESLDHTLYAERMLYYLGSRIYAKKYKLDANIIKSYYMPRLENPDLKKATLKIVCKNRELQCAGISTNTLDHLFIEIFGITTNNFTTKSDQLDSFTWEIEEDCENLWLTDNDSIESLEWQKENLADKETPEDCNQVYYEGFLDESSIDENSIVGNFIDCIKYSYENNCFYYDEENKDNFYIKDERWAFGPNRGGCVMRNKRQYYKKNGEISNLDYDWIDIGEFPRFNSDPEVPIAYPIIPTDQIERLENLANSYDYVAESNVNPIHIVAADMPWNEEKVLINKDCIKYLEHVYYDKIQTANETNK